MDQTTVVNFEWDKLKLLRDDWQVSPRDICDIAPDHIAKHFRRPGQFRLSAEHADQVGDGRAITPYFDPRLANDRKLRMRFFNTLRSKRLVTLRRKVFSFVGLSFVRKKDGSIRLVVDGRATNALHRIAPHTALGSAAAWSDIDVSELLADDKLWK